jgi:maltose/moltooligosaccharide transporter
MSEPSSREPGGPAAPEAGGSLMNRIYTAGTLRYTVFGIASLFLWLIWGEFFWVVLDQNLPAIMPLKLNELGANDTVNAILNKSIAYAVVFIFAPMVSMWSDRYRGRFGRRIPFLLVSTPFVGLFLILIGCYENLTELLVGDAEQATWLGFTLTRNGVSIAILAALMVGFDFANIFANTIYYYLFNDVVPEKFLSRFMSVFRMVGILSGMIYSKLVFPHVMEYFRLVFVLAGAGYIVGFTLMCLFVKEGQYPAPPPVATGRSARWAVFTTFFRECFTHRFYWYIFLMYMFQYVSFQAGIFAILRNTKSLGLTLQQLGNIGFYSGFISLALLFPAGWLADKYHPVRVYFVCSILQFVFVLSQCVWVFHDFGPEGNLRLYAILTFGFLPIMTLLGAAEAPLLMKLLPKEKYGQFCSANAMVRAAAVIVAGALSGVFFDLLDHTFHLGDWRYRYYTVWWAFFMIPMLVSLTLLYRQWQKLGGVKSFQPPET